VLLIISGDIESNPGPPKHTKPDDTRKRISDKAQKVIIKDSQSKVPHPHRADEKQLRNFKYNIKKKQSQFKCSRSHQYC
jgi:hypothetical protein